MGKYDAFFDGPEPGTGKYDAFFDGPDPSAPTTAPQKPNSLPYEIGRQVVGGLAVDLPKMVGGAGEWFSPEGSSAQEFFRHGKETWGASPEGWEPQVEDRSTIGKALVTGARSLAPSVAGMAAVPVAAAASPVIGSTGALGLGAAGIAALFGGSQAQETYDKGVRAGLTPEEARSAGWKTGAIEGLGETVADISGAKLFSSAGKGLMTLAGKNSTGEAIRAALDPRWAKPFAKDWMQNAAIQSGTEYAQNWGETAVENAYNISKESPHKQGTEGALSALGMSILLGPFAALAHVRSARQREAMSNILSDRDAPIELKQQVGQYLHDNVVSPTAGGEYAKQWLDSFNEKIVQDRDAQNVDYTQATGENNRVDNLDLLYERPASKTNERFGLSAASESSYGGAPLTLTNTDSGPVTGPLAGTPAPVEAVDILGLTASAAATPSATPIQVRADATSAVQPTAAPTGKFDIFGLPITDATPDVVHPDEQVAAPAAKHAKGTKAALKEGLDKQLAAGTITQEQHIEATNAVDVARTYAKAKANMEAAIKENQRAVQEQGDQQGEETLTPQAIAQRWHEYAQRWGLPTLSHLDEDQQQELFDAYDVDSLESAVRAIHYELQILGEVGNGQAVAEGNAQGQVVAEQSQGTLQKAELTPGQQMVVDYMVKAVQEGRADDIVDAKGVIQYQKIANAVGKKRGSIKSFVDFGLKRIAASYGTTVEGFKAALKQKNVESREVEPATEDKLGLSPEHQDVQVNHEDLFGSENGAESNMQIINSIGGSGSDIIDGQIAEAPPGYVDSVEPSENTKAHAAAERSMPRDEYKISVYKDYAGNPIRQVDIDDALEGWNERDGTELPRWYHMQWTLAYIANMDGVLNGHHFQEVYRGIVEDIQRQAAETSSRAENGVPASSGRPQLDAGATIEGNARHVTEPGPEQLQHDSPSSDQQGEETLTPQAIAQRWHEYAQRWGLPTLSHLDEDQQQELFNAYDVDSLESAVRAIHYELQILGEVGEEHDAGVKFSHGSETQGTSTDALNSVVAELTGQKASPKVKVVQAVNDLTEAEREAAERDAGQQLSQDEWGQVQGFTMGGKVYLIADNIPPGAERAVFLHEVGSHLGLEKLLSTEQFKRLVGQIRKWAAKNDSSQESVLAKAALQRVEDAGTVAADQDKEALAYFIEEAVKAGVDPTATKYQSELQRWFRSLWAAFKAAVRRLGMNPDKLSAQDVVNLAYGAAKLELTGTWHGTAADFRKFNHDYMGSGEGAQAYGWGTYLAQRVGIAKGYWSADVRRKGNYENTFYYDGEKLAQILPDEHDATLVAKVITAVFGGGMVGNRSAGTIERIYGVDRTVAERAAEIAKTLDPGKGRMTSGRNLPEGSLMRVDTNIQDDELLDWDKPLSEQSEKVSDVLRTAKLPPNRDGEVSRLRTLIVKGATGKQLYEALSNHFGSWGRAMGNTEGDKAASEYLDSIGIKGIKFLDSQSRSTLPDVKFVGNDNLGRNRYVKDFIVYMRRTNGDFAAAVQLMRDKFDVPVGSPKRDIVSTAVSNFLSFVKQSDFEVTQPSQTRNLVIFNDKNIQRVASQVGADRERVKFSKSIAGKFEAETASTMGYWLKAMKTKLGPSVMPLMFGHQLADYVKPILPSTAKYFQSVDAKLRDRVRSEEEISRVYAGFQKLDKGVKNAINRFIFESTSAQKWGYAPEWNSKAVVDPEMRKEFMALSPEAQQVVKDVFAHGHEQYHALRDAMNEGRSEKDKLKDNEMEGPYAPLKRFGKYAVIGKSAEYLKAESAEDHAATEKMRSDEKHYYVEFKDSLAQALQREDQLKADPKLKDLSFYSKETAEESRVLQEMPYQTMQRIKAIINADPKLRKRSKQVLSLLANQLYLRSLNSAHARKNQLRRENVAGADRDMMRAFVAQGRSDAALLATIRMNGAVEDDLQAIRTEARKPGNELKKSMALNEILKRHVALATYTDKPWQESLLKLSSLHFLLTSPAYYLTNATQPFVISAPVMAGRHGVGKTSGALIGAWKEAWDNIHLFTGNTFDVSKLKSRVGNEQAALKEIMDRNHLDIGIQMELGQVAESGGTLSNGLDAVVSPLRGVARNVETINRVSTALAAYRLEYTKRLNAGETPEQAHAGATDYADRVTVDTHGVYDAHNAPRWFMPGNSPGLPIKLMAQFKKFQLIQLGLLVKLFREGYLNKMSDTEAKAARTAFKYVLTSQAALGGLMGLPIGIPLAAIAAAVGGADGEDKEAYLRRMIGDKTLAQLLLHGAPAAAGLDVSGRLGMGNVLNPLPFVESGKDAKETLRNYTAALLGGATFSMGLKLADGLEEIAKGHYWRGVEQIVPTGIANASKAIRYETEGVTTRRGDITMHPDDIGFLAEIGQSLGLPTTSLTDANWAAGVKYNTEERFKARSADLIDHYARAVRDNDRSAAQEARDDWREMNASRRELGFKPLPLSELIKSPAAQAKRERRVIGGMEYQKSNRRFVQNLSDLSEGGG